MLVLQIFYLQIMYCFGFSRRSWHENQRTHSSMWDLHSSTEEHNLQIYRKNHVKSTKVLLDSDDYYHFQFFFMNDVLVFDK